MHMHVDIGAPVRRHMHSPVTPPPPPHDGLPTHHTYGLHIWSRNDAYPGQ